MSRSGSYFLTARAVLSFNAVGCLENLALNRLPALSSPDGTSIRFSAVRSIADSFAA